MRDYYRKKANPWPRRLLMAALVLVMVFAACKLIGYVSQQWRTRSINEELAEEMRRGQALEDQLAAQSKQEKPGLVDAQMITTQTGSSSQGPAQATEQPALNLITANTLQANLNQKPEILLNMSGLWEKNHDFVGWLNVQAIMPADGIPVVQRDHTYYLRRDFYGRSNINGTAFMDVSGCIWPRSDNLIIYAHNMKSGEMFGKLQKLRHEPTYRDDPLTTFSTLYERGTYVPLAVVQCSIHRGERFFNFAVADFRDQAEFDAYIARARELSDIESPYDAVYGDRLLTLVTCIDEAGEERLLVILRQVRENENLNDLAAMWQ